jgi:HAD superfamily hydrolase (TIGR01549 family)
VTIRAVFFDAGDCLIHRWVMKAERFAFLCREAGLSLPGDPAAILAGARAHERFFQDRRRHADTWSLEWYIRFMRTGLEAMGAAGDLEAAARQIVATSAKRPRHEMVDPEALPLLEYLRAKGYRLAIVSNWDGTLIDTVRACGLAGFFDAVLDSSVVHSDKPDTRMFEIACAATGVRPEEAIHIGDSPCADVAGAQAAGVRPVLLDALDIFGGGFYDLPAFDRIQRLAELPAWLAAEADSSPAESDQNSESPNATAKSSAPLT